MEIRLSEEALRYLEAQLAQGGYGSASDYLEQLLRMQRRQEQARAEERQGWMRLQEGVAASFWDNDADARYDAL